ncbi:type II toxin-antitoxin system VapB family antitoxin [Cupriavidus oxalaticus]|uniref:type II toxin-antitoxin system VapB family antitoxin n=1 Tax=Cupriavidus oxalaticus TaxID=96344 RepID=UPI003D183A6D
MEVTMPFTRIFRNGNSQAVRIPAELAYPDTDMPLEIERIGDELRIRPARRRLTGLLDVFAAFPDDFMAQAREDQTQAEREGF